MTQISRLRATACAVLLSTAVGLSACATAQPAPASTPVVLSPALSRDPPLRWNPAAWSAAVTECDRMAAHPSDPDRLTAGVSQADMRAAGFGRAIAACQAAVAADPGNPRLNYQLARSLGYAGRGDEAAPFREVAAGGDYPQALFVVGFVHLTGQGAPRDVCKAQRLIRRSALAGRFAGLTGYPHWVLAGAFNACPDFRRDPAELARFVGQARAHPENNDFYRGLLIDRLEAALTAVEPPAAR
jgi:hypothetical protein